MKDSSTPKWNLGDLEPIRSISRHGYERRTIRARETKYPLNTRIDQAGHTHLMDLKAYYDELTGLDVMPSVIMRRAIQILWEHMETADPRIEQIEIVRVGQNDS